MGDAEAWRGSLAHSDGHTGESRSTSAWPGFRQRRATRRK